MKPLLKDEGIDLEIVKFDDYVLPNQSLEEGDIDANYFQHIPYLNKEIKEKDMTLSMPVLSTSNQWACTLKVKDVSELKDGATIITSNSESDWDASSQF